jgi:hypothetical protein
MRSRRIGLWAWTALVGLAAACASSGGGGAGGGAAGGGAQGAATTGGQAAASAQGSVISILNTAPNAGTVAVYMVPDIGVARSLGTVDPGQQRDFGFDGEPGQYIIRAVGSTGEITTERFRLNRNSLVRWDMALGRRPQVSTRR